MLFNSLEFFIFLIFVFFAYWFLFKNKIETQNILILIVSYIFYGWWDWRFLILIIISSVVDYFCGIKIDESYNKTKRKFFLIVSLTVNLGILAFFKYYNFFVDSLKSLLLSIDVSINTETLTIILPVGISFYTFQTLSYTIDIYRERLKPEKNMFAFFAFVSFFPQLVAGPIERASHLLPQFISERKFDGIAAKEGLRQIIWGLFKKVVIADTCAIYVDIIFKNYTEYSGAVLLLGGIYFAFQIYCDFSGYSDIAIGTAKLFGFRLMNNFKYPYFSKNIKEFWSRWHISLSTWFRDYVYIPLGGNKVRGWLWVKNIFITFTLSGLWHGANWTFVIWGMLNAVYYYMNSMFILLLNRFNLVNKFFQYQLDLVKVCITFFSTVIAWVFFRSENVEIAFAYLARMFSSSILDLSGFPDNGRTMLLIAVLISIEFIGRKKSFPLENLGIPVYFRWCIYYILTLFVLYFYSGEKSFIYFQF